MKALITGCGGFIGSHLADFLVDKRIEVTGTVHKNTRNIEHLKGKIRVIKCDVKNREEVEEVLKTDYDYIFHLAAQSFVMPSWKDQENTYTTNINGTYYILDTLHKNKQNPVVLIACSSAEYGLTYENEIPIKETKEFRPTSPYAVSKVGQDMLSYLYYQTFGVKSIRIRFFNTIGPRKINNACADFAKGIAEIESGLTSKLYVGNLNSVVDLTDIRDALDALWIIANNKVYGDVFNICSGKAVLIKKVLKSFISMSNADISVSEDPAKIRPFDDPIFIGDNSKLRVLGWHPKKPLEKTLSEILEYWRKEVNKK